ncbi:hemolysin family protein [Limosilactobacillus reuteri]|uniref:HlyC/CorC family transporter n=2 Tax=Limosilactobacillus reuteri TaxID=1598 RepID=A0AAW9ZFU9_LIMRT|nr:hemolysin family protein [Limosilactobacillus reuteri]MCC4340590.1 hemolysin family protein [Limosilactobacillus reuteri]MCC4346707.1 hemolysin family protein [Limosilactobacillus reuteri]MCC4350147.1 hemolysin family protein [Limosilactobacillus reuteri]MCC4360342.1 hemolysin family protein [Limosilactobacillus reuteri]MCC4367005.1 hemolysin family protein [Limosilactobacillus reuteri]
MRNVILNEGQLFTNFIIIIITFIFAAFFVAAEFALVQARVTALEEMQAKRDKPSAKINRAIKMVTNLTEYLSTTQVGVSICGIILGWVGEGTIEELLTDALSLPSWSLNNSVIHVVSAIVGVLLLTYFEVVLTEIVPKNISIDIPIKTLMFVTTPLHYFHITFYPFVWLLNSSANGIVKMLGMKPADESQDVLSQSEIISLSRNAVKGGELEHNDLLYMERAFDFNDKVAKDIMIDRTQLAVIDINKTVNDAIKLYLKTKYSRLPVVADNDKDKILGYVFNYDLIRQKQINGDVSLAKVLRHMPTTPETTPITEVLKLMISTRVPMVVVVDEYGGTSGIITDKDIYEELFGTVRDEIDNVSDNMISKIGENQYRVDGKTTIYDFERFFHVELKDSEDSDVVTLSGYVLDNYHNIHEGETIKLADLNLKIQDYRHSYIDSFIVTTLSK